MGLICRIGRPRLEANIIGFLSWRPHPARSYSATSPVSSTVWDLLPIVADINPFRVADSRRMASKCGILGIRIRDTNTRVH